MRISASFLIALALAMTLAACGRGDSDGAPPSPSDAPEPPAAEPSNNQAPEVAGKDASAETTIESSAANSASNPKPEWEIIPELDADWEYTPFQIQSEADPKITETLIGTKPDLDLTFTNQEGETVNLGEAYKGKTIVLSTIYTSCPVQSMCPRLTDDFAWLQRQIPRAIRDDVQFVLVSFDPQRDTPEVLKSFGRKHGLKFDNAALLRGDIDETRKLIAMLVHVVNRDGYIVVERTVNTSEPMEKILEEIDTAARRKFIPPPSDSEREEEEG